MKLLQNSGIPIYQQITDQLRADILAGRLKEGGISSLDPQSGKGLEDQRYHHDEGI